VDFHSGIIWTLVSGMIPVVPVRVSELGATGMVDTGCPTIRIASQFAGIRTGRVLGKDKRIFPSTLLTHGSRTIWDHNYYSCYIFLILKFVIVRQVFVGASMALPS
jgi:hypothetical protein